MPKFPVDAPRKRVVRALDRLGFQLVREREHIAMVREREHIAMVRENANGTRTPLTMPNHLHIKGSTLRAICTQSDISREDFLRAYEQS